MSASSTRSSLKKALGKDDFMRVVAELPELVLHVSWTPQEAPHPGAVRDDVLDDAEVGPERAGDYGRWLHVVLWQSWFAFAVGVCPGCFLWFGVCYC